MRVQYLVLAFLLIVEHLRGQEFEGVLKDTVICSKESGFSYALYVPKLPRNNSKARKLLLFFEPGGRAALPIKLYSPIADKYELILACSYQSKNGPVKNSIDAYYAVINDLKSKYEINQIWLSGFSGGARAASLIATLGSEFSGVIACGATFPTGAKITQDNAVPFAEIIGVDDMNFAEAIHSLAYLSNLQIPSILFQFNGGHKWPPSDIFEQAVQWQLLNRDALTTEQRSSFFSQLFKSVKVRYDSANIYTSWLIIAQPIPGSSSHESQKVDSIRSYIVSSPDYNYDKAEFTKALENEDKLMGDFSKDFVNMILKTGVDSLFDPSQWLYKRKNIDKLIHSGNKYKSHSGKRIYDYCLRTCVEQYGFFLESKEYNKALQSAKIGKAFSPENPIPLVLLAQAYALKGLNKQSLLHLQKAVKKGYKNKDYLLNESAFQTLRDSEGFKKIISQL